MTLYTQQASQQEAISERESNKAFEGHKIALLLATGFDEKAYLTLQKFLRRSQAFLKLVSTDQGLVTSWQGTGWGHNYAVDLPINKALAADFSMCIIPGGSRNADKLALSAHTKRFINGFLMSSKPVLTINEANELFNRLEIEAGSPLENAVTEPQSNDNRSGAVVRNMTLFQVFEADHASSGDDITKALDMASSCLYNM